jgi:hypothetical protein
MKNLSMPEKTIRNPVFIDNAKSYCIYYEDDTRKVLGAVGATNAWFISSSLWPDSRIAKIEELQADESTD